MDKPPPLITLWNPKHVDKGLAEEALGIARQAIQIVGAAGRVDDIGGGRMRYRNSGCSVTHETTPQLATNLSVLMIDAELFVEIPALLITGEHLPAAPKDDPDPARYAIRALEAVVETLEAFEDAHRTFEHDERGRFIDGVRDAALRAAIISSAFPSGSVIAATPWSNACITASGTVVRQCPIADEQLALLPPAVCIQQLWMEKDDRIATHHLRLSALAIDVDHHDPVGALRLAGRPVINPALIAA